MDTFPLHILEAGRQHHLSLYTSSLIHADPIDIYYCLSARISVPLYLSIFDKHAAKSWAQICHVDRSALMLSVVNASPPVLQSQVMKFALENTDLKSEFRFSYLWLYIVSSSFSISRQISRHHNGAGARLRAARYRLARDHFQKPSLYLPPSLQEYPP